MLLFSFLIGSYHRYGNFDICRQIPYWIHQLLTVHPQSRQSTKLSLQSSELELPHPLTPRRVCTQCTTHPPLVGGGAIPTKGQTL
jgi:hypothetical protein